MRKLYLLFIFLFLATSCQAGITIVAPNGGEELISGQTETISWDNVGDINDVKIEFSDSNGQTWTDVNSAIPNIGSYDWLVPEVTSPNCLVRISDANDANIYDVSDDVFTMFQCLGPIPGDLNNDCYVNNKDFAIVAEHWLHTGNPLDSASGIVAYWKFDEGTGTTAYDSAGDNDGNLVGEPNWIDSISGKALDFNGLSDYVEVLNNSNQQITTNKITVSAWIKLNADVGFNGQVRIVNKQQLNGIAWGLEIFGEGKHGATGNQLTFHDSDGLLSWRNCTSPTHLNHSQWYHFAVTDNAGLITTYIDGQEDYSCNDGFGIPSNIDAPIIIGATNVPNAFFNGIIDEVRIYNRALTATEIQYLYENL